MREQVTIARLLFFLYILRNLRKKTTIKTFKSHISDHLNKNKYKGLTENQHTNKYYYGCTFIIGLVLLSFFFFFL